MKTKTKCGKKNCRSGQSQERMMRGEKTGIMKEGGNVWRDTGMAGQIMNGSIINNCLGFLKTSSQVLYGIHYKIIGTCIRRNSTTKGMIFKMMKKGGMTKNATKATKKIGELTSRIMLSVMELMTHWVTMRMSPRETDREWHNRGNLWDWLVKLLSDMFKNIWFFIILRC